MTVIGYTQLPVDDTMMLFLGFPLGFFSQGVFSGMGPFLTELFPTRMRGSGQGFAYNFGRGIAAMNPLLVGMLSAVLPLGQSIGVFAVIAYGLLTAAALLLPETKGRLLRQPGSVGPGDRCLRGTAVDYKKRWHHVLAERARNGTTGPEPSYSP